MIAFLDTERHKEAERSPILKCCKIQEQQGCTHELGTLWVSPMDAGDLSTSAIIYCLPGTLRMRISSRAKNCPRHFDVAIPSCILATILNSPC